MRRQRCEEAEEQEEGGGKGVAFLFVSVLFATKRILSPRESCPSPIHFAEDRERERERERNEREGECRERRTREEEKDLCFFYTPTLSPRFFYFFSSTLPSTTIDSLLVTKARTSSSANFIVQCPLSDPFCPGGGNALPATRSPPKT